jgi:PKD repeat protein
VIKLSLSAATSFFQLFPNPVVNNFTASFTAPRTTTATLLIRNSNGQTVYSKSINVVKGSNAIPVNNAPLTTGMFYVTIANDDFNFTGKLQKR